MIKRVVGVESACELSVAYGQLKVRRSGEAVGSVPIEDLGVLVLDYTASTITVPLLAALTEAGVAVVVCDEKHFPCGLLTPIAGNYAHGDVLRDQIAMSEPQKKRLWQSIVVAKIEAQADLLRYFGLPDLKVRSMARRVLSGDTGNAEGLAASHYFDALFGSDFFREAPGGPGLNAWLNYGYAVVRAAVGRAICGAGLHPALGLYHGSRFNAFGLADDLMEPLRPLVDYVAFRALRAGEVQDELAPAAKRRLLEVLTCRVRFGGRSYPLLTALSLYAAHYRDCIEGQKRKMRCPVIDFDRLFVEDESNSGIPDGEAE